MNDEPEFERMREDFAIRPGEEMATVEQPHWIVRLIIYLWLAQTFLGIALEVYAAFAYSHALD